jgi:hypothetical protein
LNVRNPRNILVALAVGLGCHQTNAVTVPLVQDAMWDDGFTPGVATPTQFMCSDYVSLASPSTCVNWVGTTVPPYDENLAEAALKFTLPQSGSVLSTADLYLKVMDRLGSPTATVTLTDDNNWIQTTSSSTSKFPGLSNASALLTNGSVASTGWIHLSLATSALDAKIVSSGTTDATLIVTGSVSTSTYFDFVADDDASGNKAYLVLTFKPQVQSVSVPSNATYKIGDALDFTVAFDSTVTVTGTPRIPLTLNTGGTVYATYTSGSASKNLVFRYTVSSGDLDADGISLGSAISLNGGTIKSASGNDAELNLYGAASTSSVLVDGVAPSISGVSAPANSTYRIGQNLDYTATFSEAVNVVTTGGTPYLTLTVGSSSVHAAYQSGSGTSSLVFRYTVSSGDLDGDGVAVASNATLNGGTIKDAAGNNATLTFSGSTAAAVLVDGVAPSISSVSPPSSTTYGAGQNLDYTVNFGEAVNVVTSGGTPYLTLTVGSSSVHATYQSGSGTSSLVFRYTVSSGDLDGDGVAVASNATLNGGTIQDAAGNGATLTFSGSTAAGVLVDGRTAQTITFGSLPTQTYGTSALKMTASSNSGLAISYASSNTAVARISNDTAYLLKADTATITASQAGNGTYKAATPVAQKLTVAKKTLTVTGASAQNKTYDGTTSATLSGGSLSGLVGSDVVTLTVGTATFANKNVQTGKAVTVTGSTISGADAGNYGLTEVSGLSADIGAKTLTVTGVSAQSKTYDGTTSATLSGGSLVGVVGSDVVTLSLGTATFSTKSVGTGKSVAVTGSAISGADAGNYSLTEVSGLTADISAKNLTVTGVSAQNKTYDGTTSAALSGGSLVGVVGSDVVTLSLGTATFSTKNVGTGKSVAVTGSGIFGTDAGNYSLTEVSGLTADISAKGLTVTDVSAQNKAYDGTTSAALGGGSLVGVVGSESVALTLGTASFANKNAGTGKSVTVTGSGISGADAGNYSLTEVSGLTADIATYPVTVTARDTSKKVGDSDPVFPWSAGALFTGDSWTGSLTRTTGETAGDYDIVQGSLDAGSNYAVTFHGAKLTIQPATSLKLRPVGHATSREPSLNMGRLLTPMAVGRNQGRLGEGLPEEGEQSVDVLLTGAASVDISIFDHLGTPVISWSRDIPAFEFGQLPSSGDGRRVLSVSWNLRASQGEPVPSGVYLWKVRVQGLDGTKMETVRKTGVR